MRVDAFDRIIMASDCFVHEDVFLFKPIKATSDVVNRFMELITGDHLVESPIVFLKLCLNFEQLQNDPILGRGLHT